MNIPATLKQVLQSNYELVSRLHVLFDYRLCRMHVVRFKHIVAISTAATAIVACYCYQHAI
jgi:hypothetical protein